MALDYDAHVTDPPFLETHSTITRVETSRFVYPSLRIFFKRQSHEDQLPVDPAPIPLLVFVHGLGGSVAQLHPLITHLHAYASCLAVDFPGCGRSLLSPLDWSAYTSEALVEVLEVVVAQHRRPEQSVVLIGHSMGCSLSALFAFRQSKLLAAGLTSVPVSGLAAISPVAELADERTVLLLKAALWIPAFIFNFWRAWDSRGGLQSASVSRFVGSSADEDTKRLQLRFNRQSKTDTWRRMAWGSLPSFVNGKPVGGLAGRDVWASLNLPVCLITGESDHISPPGQIKKIRSFLGSAVEDRSAHSETTSLSKVGDGNLIGCGMEPGSAEAQSAAAASTPSQERSGHEGDAATEAPRKAFPVDNHTLAGIAEADFASSKVASDSQAPDDDIPTTPGASSDKLDIPPIWQHPPKFIESHVVPKPAGHAMLYATCTVGVISGLIASFLSQHVTGRLDRGWQLRFLSREGKWDVKNLEKWSKVEPVSRPIAGIFRAMKTLRQADDVHSPRHFVEKWSDSVKDVIDISHDSPVYDPHDLEAGGIRYHKFPTVSKIPPTAAEIEVFENLVDKIRARQKQEAAANHGNGEATTGVHCHYGFNRTGYFIVCYLVDRCGFTVDEAVRLFAEARPVGIRHSHFLDALSLRYAGVDHGFMK